MYIQVYIIKKQTSFVLYRTIGIQETICGHYFILFLFQSDISIINTFFCVLYVTLIKTTTIQCKTFKQEKKKSGYKTKFHLSNMFAKSGSGSKTFTYSIIIVFLVVVSISEGTRFEQYVYFV